MKDGIREISNLLDDQGYEDAQLIQTITLSLTNTLPALTLQVWAGKVKKESDKKVSMILKEFLEKKNQGTANEDVMMAVEEESAENPSSILGIIEKRLAKQNRRHKAHIDPMTQALKKERQKNSLDQGQVGQPSKVTKNRAKRSGISKNGKEIKPTSTAEHQDPDHQDPEESYLRR